MKTLSMKSLQRTALSRPEGYLEDVLAMATVDGDKVLLDDKSYVHLLAKYRPRRTYSAPVAGPGSELKAILGKWLGIASRPGCKCNARAQKMDENGCQWCLDNLDEIVGWLKEEHERQKVRLPFVPMVAKQLVRLAIRNARKKGTCR